MQPLWRVPREWEGETAFLICGGPSVNAVDLNRLRGRKVIAINSSYLAAPWADFLIFTDIRWWRLHHEPVSQVFQGRVVTITPTWGTGFLTLERQRSSGLSSDPTRLALWHTTVTAALNLLAHLGAGRVGLLGLDGQRTSSGASWHHSPHPWRQNPRCYTYHGEALTALVGPLVALGMQVLNLNPESAHRMFPFSTIDEMLA
jgi:hypothetical protein